MFKITLNGKTIVGNNSVKQDSLVCREWLNYLNNDNIVPEVPSIEYFDNENIRDYVFKGYVSVYEVDIDKNIVFVFSFIKYRDSL